MKYLYKYPQREFPYEDLVETNRRRSREEFEYELLDTGVFDDDRYFDVFVEYAKGGPGRRAGPHHRAQPRARGGPAARAADAVVPQYLVVGRRRRQAAAARSGAGHRAGRASRTRRLLAALRRRAGTSLHREREQRAAAVEPAQSIAVCEGCVPRVPDRRGDGGREPGPDGHQGRGALHARRSRGRQQDRAAAPGGREGRRSVRRVRHHVQEPSRRCGRVLCADRPADADRGSASRAPAGAGRHALGQAVLLLRSRALAARAQEPSAARSRSGATCATPSGSTCSTPT